MVLACAVLKIKLYKMFWRFYLTGSILILSFILLSCSKDEDGEDNGHNNQENNIVDCGGIITDSRDGQEYPTILIGDRCWFQKNLNVGIMIDGSKEQTNNDTIEKYCYNNAASLCDEFGGLYQWDEMMQYDGGSLQGICPEGWHVPDDYEWQALEIELGMSPEMAAMENTWRGAEAGMAMKPGGNSGFDILLGGGCWSNGSFAYMNMYGYYWTSTESNANAWRRCFSATENTIGRYDSFSKDFAFSVRCIKSKN